MKLQKYLHKSVAQRIDSKHFCSIPQFCHSKFHVRNDHKQFCSIEELLHTFFHTVTLHLLQNLFMNLKNTPWFSWLEEFP